MTERSERAQRIDPAGAAAIPPPAMSLPAVPPGLRRIETEHWTGVSGRIISPPTDEEIERIKAALSAAGAYRAVFLPPDPMEVMLRESATAYGQAFVYRNPATGEDQVLDPKNVTIVKPAVKQAGPFRLDLPSVPEHVTCLEGQVDEDTTAVWVRMSGDRWAPVFDESIGRLGRIGTARLSLLELMRYMPLVEHPDPRKES